MSDGAWDADEFEPSAAVPDSNFTTFTTDKWDGEDEDEDDDVKASWDRDSEEEKEQAASVIENSSSANTKSKKKSGKIETNQQASTDGSKLSLEERLRLQKIEESNNLLLARDMLGFKSGSIDNMVPVTKEEFDQFRKALCDKVQLFTSSDHFSDFIEKFIKELSLDLNAQTLKRIKLDLEAIHLTKLQEEKIIKAKGKSKRKSIRMDLTKDLFSGHTGEVDYDDVDDFM